MCFFFLYCFFTFYSKLFFSKLKYLEETIDPLAVCENEGIFLSSFQFQLNTFVRTTIKREYTFHIKTWFFRKRPLILEPLIMFQMARSKNKGGNDFESSLDDLRRKYYGIPCATISYLGNPIFSRYFLQIWIEIEHTYFEGHLHPILL